MPSLKWEDSYFDPNFIQVRSSLTNKQSASIGSDDGLAPNRCQLVWAIIWRNDSLGCWRIRHSASLGLLSTPDSKIHGANMGPSGADRTQVGAMLAPWTLLSGPPFTNMV